MPKSNQALCSAASAQTTSVFNLTNGSFANAYKFSVTGPSVVTGDTNSVGITWFGALLQAPALSYTALDTNPDDGFSFSGLSAGTYSLTFLGTVRVAMAVSTRSPPPLRLWFRSLKPTQRCLRASVRWG
jgi:hypothetical protein